MTITRERFHWVIPKLNQERIDNNQCPACGKPKSEWTRRTDWSCCSKECSDEFWQKTVRAKDPAVFRDKVLERDNYICVQCGANHKKYPYNLVADHIVPIAIGGDQWDIENGQTLCRNCDRAKTSNDLKKIALFRRVERNNPPGQTQLTEVKRANSSQG